MPLPGFIRNDQTSPEMAGALLSRSAAPGEAVVQTLADGGTTGLLTDQVVRNARYGLESLAGPSANTLTPQEATARYGIEGALSFDRPISENAAAYRSMNKRDELLRRDLLARNETVGGVESFGLSMLGQSVIDPLGFAMNFVPIAGEGKIFANLGFSAEALAATRSASIMTGVARGGLEAGIGSLAVEGGQYGLAHGVEGRDYSLDDAITGVTGGVLFGGALGGGLGGLSWRSPHATGPGLADLAGRIEHQESRGVQSAVSPKGAIGVMQLMPDTAKAAAKRLGVPFDLARLQGDAVYNRALGREELRHLMARYDGDEMLASAAYNAGPGNVDRWLKSFGDPRTGAITHEEFAGKIPFAETRDYVGKVGAGTAEVPRLTLAEDFDRLPRSVAALDEAARSGALSRAVDDLAADRPTDVGALIDAELARGGGARPHLDEDPAATGLAIRGALGDAGVATTARGEAIPIRNAIVEAHDLVASHDVDLIKRPDHPADLAPRQDGARWLAERVKEIEGRQDHTDLVLGEAADRGPPIISRDGVVEAGGDKVIALQRLADTEGRFEAYRAQLAAQGHDIEGFHRPVLVRVRDQPMTGAQRVRLAREIEADRLPAPPPEPKAGARRAAAPTAVEAPSPGRAINDQAAARLRGDLDEPAAEAPRQVEPFVAPDKLTAETVIAADPELQDLVASIDQAAAELEGLGAPKAEIDAATATADRDKPKTIAELVRSAVFCLTDGAV